MTKIGIDFSINSPGICIEKDEYIFFYGGIRLGKKLRKIETKCLDRISNIERCKIFYLPAKQIGVDYSAQESLNLEDGIKCTNIVLEILKENISDPANCSVGIEGFSYNSSGSSTDRIYGYGYMLRYLLNKEGYQFKIFSPATVKKTAGKGNFSKEKMVGAFLENHLNDEKLNLNFLRNNIINNINDFKDTKSFLKPLEDMVDAYWVSKSL